MLLREGRLAARLTQAALCERAGISPRALQDLERGVRQPHRDTLERLASALNLADDGRLALARTVTPTPRRRASRNPSFTAELTGAARRDRLPQPLTAFVGRERERTEIRALLRERRLVTLAGAGGIGKTRLSLQVAADLAAERREAAWFVDLGPLGHPDRLVAYTAAVFGVRQQPNQALIDTLCEALGDQAALIVLDNCEHLLEACVALVARLLGSGPGIRVLATSREPLRITGEVVWRVGPLELPENEAEVTLDSLLAASASRLLLERAGDGVGPAHLGSRAMRAVVRICERLDGMPLAIELAAARTCMFSFEQIAALLDDTFALLTRGDPTAPDRHQTLRSAIDWSYGLLDGAEQCLLAKLSVFRGGCTFDAVTAVASGDAPPASGVLDVLAGLIDKSLVQTESRGDGTTRFRLLETVRQYAAERLAACERSMAESVACRHAGYFLSLAQQGPPRMQTGERKLWLDRLELELDNFRAAGAWFVERGDAEGALRLNSALYFALVYRMPAAEGRASLVESLALPGGEPSTRATALHCLGALAVIQSDYAAADRYGQESLALRRVLGDDTALAWSFFQLGSAALFRSDLVRARRLFIDGRAHATCARDGYLTAMNEANLAYASYLAADYAAACAEARSALALSRTSGYASPQVVALAALGGAKYMQADLSGARVALEAALHKAEALEEQFLITRAAGAVATVAADQGDFARAEDLLRKGLQLARQLGNRHQMARMLEAQAACAARGGELARGRRLLEAAAALRQAIVAPLSPTERRILAAHGLHDPGESEQ